uniref:Cadherin domain-containing protein n=1 Tax=Hucho hucho TaxID=62062 RepID=A0A4W5QSG2_9TELE
MTKRIGYRNWRWLALWWRHFILLWSTIDGQTRYTIPEELKQGSVVGNLAKDLGLGLSEIFDRKLRVASEAGKQYFNVDAGKGELVVNERIDRDTLCRQSASCVLPLQVVIENPLQLHRIEVEIRDINDNSPNFLTKDRVLKMAELTAVGARFPLESAEDPDVGSNSLKSYILSKDECFSVKVKDIEGGRKIPELVLEKPLDREKKAVHELLLTALDGGTPARSGTSQITVTVLDNNDNNPVFQKAVYKVRVNENSEKGTSLIKLEATDSDEGVNGEIEYSFGEHTLESVLSVFDIDAVTGEMFLRGELDYEVAASYRIDITAVDKGSPEMEGHCRVQVEVIDVNDNAPEIVLTSKPSPVREDAPSGTVVALISGRDLDSGNNGKVTLQLTNGHPFSLKPSFSNNYALVTSGVLDRESSSEYNIEITATDAAFPPLTTKKTIPVSVIDVNDNPPKFSQSSYNVYLKENGLPGSMLSSVSASDLDFGDNAKISYSILDFKVQDVSVSSYVYINSDNGSIYSMHSYDYEKLKGFQILVQAKDHGSPSLSSNATVHVFILDQNDNAPAVIYPSAALGSLPHQKMPRSTKAGYLVTKVTAVDADSGHNAWISYRLAEATDTSLFSELTVKIVELTVAGARFPLESAEDPDVGSNSLKSYTISKDECFTLKVKELGNGKKIPELVLEKPLDREKKSVHKLLLTAIDGGNPVRSGTAEITITVLDVNDNFPVFEKSVYKVSILENSAKGTFMIKLKATDIDEGQNGEIKYSFGERTPESVLSTFNMVPDTGDIFLKGDLDFERATTYDIDITARDEGTPEMEGHCRVQVEVIDVNDNSPEIVLTSQPNPVRENAPSGTVVALISARDLDSGNNGKVKLQLPRGYPFSLKPSFSNNYALVTSGVLDRESSSEYNIEITATDSGSPPLTTKKTIPVTIIDVNDNPPKFSQPFYDVCLKENGLPGSMLSSVSASDLDFGGNAKISYSILDSKVQDVSVSSYVYMNTDNGSIYSMHSFDYEKLKVFQILVQAKDHGSPSLSSNVTVHVFILDQNDNAPAVIYPSAGLGSLSHQKMPRSTKAGYLVTKVTAVDADSGHNAWISYKLVEVTDASLFSVNLYTGEVRTKRAVSEQDDSSQRLLIEIQDDGEPVQSSTVTLAILVEDGLHEPILDLRQKVPEPSKKSGRITLYLILSLASVSVLSMVTFIILAVKCVRNSRSSGSCCMRRDDFDGNKNPNRNLQIQLNTDGQSFRSCLSPMSEFSDFTFVKPSSTTDFKEMINVLDASLPDSAWTFESQQVSGELYFMTF